MTGEAFPEPVLILAFNRPDRVAALIDRLHDAGLRAQLSEAADYDEFCAARKGV